MEALALVAETGGPTMLARIGVMRALNRHVERVFNPDRKDQSLGQAQAEERPMTSFCLRQHQQSRSETLTTRSIQRVTKSLDRKAAEDLVMQYRVERAARRVGKFSLLVFVLVLVAVIASYL